MTSVRYRLATQQMFLELKLMSTLSLCLPRRLYHSWFRMCLTSSIALK